MRWQGFPHEPDIFGRFSFELLYLVSQQCEPVALYNSHQLGISKMTESGGWKGSSKGELARGF